MAERGQDFLALVSGNGARQTLNQPVYLLLGGAVRDRVRMYTHLGGGEMKAVYETQYSGDPQVFTRSAPSPTPPPCISR